LVRNGFHFFQLFSLTVFLALLGKNLLFNLFSQNPGGFQLFVWVLENGFLFKLGAFPFLKYFSFI